MSFWFRKISRVNFPKRLPSHQEELNTRYENIDRNYDNESDRPLNKDTSTFVGIKKCI